MELISRTLRYASLARAERLGLCTQCKLGNRGLSRVGSSRLSSLGSSGCLFQAGPLLEPMCAASAGRRVFPISPLGHVAGSCMSVITAGPSPLPKTRRALGWPPLPPAPSQSLPPTASSPCGPRCECRLALWLILHDAEAKQVSNIYMSYLCTALQSAGGKLPAAGSLADREVPLCG